MNLAAEEYKAFAERSRRDPVWWSKAVFGTNLWASQQQIIESVRDNIGTAVKTGHAVGKTFTGASTILWFLYSHCPSIVLLTAPTWRQVEKQLWAEVRVLHSKAKIKLGGEPLERPELKLDDKWYALGLSTKESERFAGFHQKYILIVVDEASGVPQGIFEAIRGVMASGHVRILMLGNPTRPEGELYDAFAGKRSIYNTISVNAFDTPNLMGHKEHFDSLATKHEKVKFLKSLPIVIPHLISPTWMADMLDDFGEDSPVWKVRVLAEFAPSTPDQLIPLHWVEDAETRYNLVQEQLAHEYKYWWDNPPEGSVELGVDVARYGDAETVITARYSDCAAPQWIGPKADTGETAGSVIQQAKRYKAVSVRIDSVGVGAGVYDNCRNQDLEGVQAINGGSTPRNTDRFLNERAESFWELRQRFEQGRIYIPTDIKLSGQLSSIRYKASIKGKTQIESKEDMRNRGMKSPDRADSLCMAFMNTGFFGTVRVEPGPNEGNTRQMVDEIEQTGRRRGRLFR